MGKSDVRPVAPGVQVSRVDKVKGASWVILDFPPPLIGRIFFSTKDATLDNSDMAKLEIIVGPYQQKLREAARRGLNLYFEFRGYADKRDTPNYNYGLSGDRAQAVADYLADKLRLGGFTSYVPETRGHGIDYSVTGESSEELKLARRVDIHADRFDVNSQSAPERPGVPVSAKWRARLYNAVSAGYGVAAADQFFLEIVDAMNNLALSYHYVGGGVGWSWRGTPGISASSSGWVDFTTMLNYNIMDFEGDAAHVCGQAQAGGGGGFDGVTLFGRAARPITPRARIWFDGVTAFDKGAGLGSTSSVGVLVPAPLDQKPYWPPRVP